MFTTEEGDMKVLLIVDVQNDFCHGGSLEVPGSDEIIPLINQLTSSNSFDLVVATKDWHPVDHESFLSTWPVHCVQGTSGAEFHPKLDTSNIQHIVNKGTDRDVDSYSAFFDNDHKKETPLRKILEKAQKELSTQSSNDPIEIVITGLALDYCVAFSARDAASLGYKTSILLDATRSVEQNQRQVISKLRELQDIEVEITTSLHIASGKERVQKINRDQQIQH